MRALRDAVSYLTRVIMTEGLASSTAAHATAMEARLEAELSRLRPVYREAICLRAYCGMSDRRIAETLGLPSENTAKALFLRARAELRKRL